eukprot:8776074-Karenia_brevis.AAC.1
MSEAFATLLGALHCKAISHKLSIIICFAWLVGRGKQGQPAMKPSYVQSCYTSGGETYKDVRKNKISNK